MKPLNSVGGSSTLQYEIVLCFLSIQDDGTHTYPFGIEDRGSQIFHMKFFNKYNYSLLIG